MNTYFWANFWANRAADATILLIYVGIYGIIGFIIYKLAKRLIKYGIEYYFQLKELNRYKKD